MVLRQAIRRFETPTTILSGDGSYFVGACRGHSKRSRKPTVFEEDLLGRGIELINSRSYQSRGSQLDGGGVELLVDIISVYCTKINQPKNS